MSGSLSSEEAGLTGEVTPPAFIPIGLYPAGHAEMKPVMDLKDEDRVAIGWIPSWKICVDNFPGQHCIIVRRFGEAGIDFQD